MLRLMWDWTDVSYRFWATALLLASVCRVFLPSLTTVGTFGWGGLLTKTLLMLL